MGLIWGRVFSIVIVLLLILLSVQLFQLTVELRTVGGELKVKMVETTCGVASYNDPCQVVVEPAR